MGSLDIDQKNNKKQNKKNWKINKEQHTENKKRTGTKQNKQKCRTLRQISCSVPVPNFSALRGFFLPDHPALPDDAKL